MVGFDPGIKELTKMEHAYAGAASGVVTRMIAQPLDVIKIRFQVIKIASVYQRYVHPILQR